jgi:sec-independent protein translocase protein TatA
MTTLAYFGMPGGSEVILILFIVLLLFGAKKLPELSRSLGKSLGEFKKGKDDLEKELRDIQTDAHDTMTTPEPVSEDDEGSDQDETVKAPLSGD